MLPNKRGIFYAQVTFSPFYQIFFTKSPPPPQWAEIIKMCNVSFKVDNVFRQDTKIESYKINCFSTSIWGC